MSALQVAAIPPTTGTATPAPTEKLLTLQQVAALAGVSRWTTWRWTTQEGLRTVRIGSVTRIRERDWLAFLDRHTGKGGEVSRER